MGGGDGRVRRLSLAGRPVEPERRFLLVTSNFRADGGGAFPGMAKAQVLRESREQMRHILARYLKARICGEGPPPAESWRLRFPQGATAIFRTAPAAGERLNEIAHLRPTPLGLDEQGFLHLRLHG